MERLTKRDWTRRRKIQIILDMLAEKPCSIKEIAEKLHIAPRWTRPYLTELSHKDENQKIYIMMWTKSPTTPGLWNPVYALGPYEDAPYPQPTDRAAKERQNRAKLKGDAEKYELTLARRRALRAPIRRDPLVEALFGKAKSNVKTGIDIDNVHVHHDGPVSAVLDGSEEVTGHG